ncbi:MAG: tyrosine-protein phosphatase [Thermoleophilia bacterium]|nr:tyrosine-protein phosphatase [Thermoleophilia bacterium]
MPSGLDGPLAHDLPARFNFRDLGGFEAERAARLAWGRLYRGASLHHLDPDELERFEALGMRTVVDLRTPSEFGDVSAPPLPALAARSLPMFRRLPDFPKEPGDPSALMSDLYMSMLESGAATIAAVLELLAAEDSYPLAFYCAAGKDRTGVMSAIVFELLGVPREQIVRDYALSDAPVESLRSWIAENDPERHDPVPAGIYRAPAATMRSFLGRLDERYGSVRGYLHEIGVPGSTDAAVERNLLVRA